MTFVAMPGCSPYFSKADIDFAYRRIPIMAAHRWASFIALKHCGINYVGQLLTMPFGVAAAIHSWDHIGAFLRHLGRRLLKMPFLRYMDGFVPLDRLGCTQHAMNGFARITRSLLGGKREAVQGQTTSSRAACRWTSWASQRPCPQKGRHVTYSQTMWRNGCGASSRHLMQNTCPSVQQTS